MSWVRAPDSGTRLIERANEISIFGVLEDLFGIKVPSEGRSFKSYCPYAFEHPDGGVEKGWRTYPSTNSSFCFVMHGYLDPVRLVSIQRDVRPVEAAKWLLRHYGLLKPVSYGRRMQELLAEREASVQRVGSTAYLVEALQAALSAIPAYAERQFAPDVAAAMEEELEGLDAILVNIRGDPSEPVRSWYSEAKRHLSRIVEAHV